MYTPRQFEPESEDECLDFVRANPFGILATCSSGDSEIEVTHTPFLVSDDGKTLTGHIARANPHWKDWSPEGRTQAKCLFHGPHTYISPRFYASEFNVPTWNYTAVNVAGTLRIEQSPERSSQFLSDLTEQFEPANDGWKIDPNDERFDKLMQAIIVFHIRIDSIVGKFKLNQNKSREDQLSVINNLRNSAGLPDQQIASLMEANLESTPAN